MSNVKHVVILMLENRSFDEYFGTFPGANGFFSNPESAFSNAFSPSGGSAVLPYRLSTFSSQQGHTPGCAHDWGSQHDYWAGGAMNGWASDANSIGCMGYYAADDIPYHWWLAQNFALCDNYFCSVLGPTEPNRLYMASGKIDASSSEFTVNPTYTPPIGWPSYADLLSQAGVTWKVYDFSGSANNPSDVSSYGVGYYNILNPFAFFPSWASVAPTNSTQDPTTFAADASAGSLPTVSWVIPNYGSSEHPPFSPWDGAAFMSQIVEAVVGGADWESTVLIITYDENDGHFDHQQPPTAPNGAADEIIGGLPIGAGFRIPTIVVSPWTWQRGVWSDQYDHTSIIQFLEDVTGVSAEVNVPTGGWRRSTFKSLSTLGFANPAPAVTVVGQPDVATLQQNAIARWSAAPASASGPPAEQTWPPVAQGCQVIMTSPSYGQGQVDIQPGSSFPQAFIVVVDGFEPAELTTPNAIGALETVQAKSPPNPSCTTRIPTITITDASGQPVDNLLCVATQIDYDPNYEYMNVPPPSGVPQRYTFTFSLTFEDPADTFSFPTGTVQTLFVTATFQVDITVTSTAQLELVTTDDPQFFHEFYGDTPWLSGELRVFSLTAGLSMFGVQLGAAKANTAGFPYNVTSDDALAFIEAVMSTLTQNQGTVPGIVSYDVSSFDQLNQTEEGSSLPLYPANEIGIPIFNFALARVRMQAASADPATVRVFFRSFRASSTSCSYETPYAYRSYPLPPNALFGANEPPPTPLPPPDTRIPLLGVGYDGDAGEYVTIPFFATQRIQITDPSARMTAQTDTPNVQVMQTGMYGGVPDGGTVENYFGCWLDINQPATPVIPYFVPLDPDLVDGPFPPNTDFPSAIGGNNPALSITQAFLNDLHQCLVAEISYDPITIPDGDTPASSAWLAQRNLGLNPTPNPGIPSSRHVLDTFDIRATSPAQALGLPPDELMFDWSNLPAGTTASIYLPAASADAVMATAASMYGSQPFTRIDASTLGCKAQGTTYMPIPVGTGNLAGLLDIELPATVHKGDTYVVVVNQITNAFPTPSPSPPRIAIALPTPPAPASTSSPWRKIYGTFQITVAVGTKSEILPTAERELAVLRCILQATPQASRWYPVMSRYLSAFADRLAGLGGNPGSIPASCAGSWPGGPGLPGSGAGGSGGGPGHHGGGPGGGSGGGPGHHGGGSGSGSGGGPGHHGGGADEDGHAVTGKIEGLVFDHFGEFEGFVLETESGRLARFFSRERAVHELAARAWAERQRLTVVPEDGHEHRIRRVILHPPPHVP